MSAQPGCCWVTDENRPGPITGHALTLVAIGVAIVIVVAATKIGGFVPGGYTTHCQQKFVMAFSPIILLF